MCCYDPALWSPAKQGRRAPQGARLTASAIILSVGTSSSCGYLLLVCGKGRYSGAGCCGKSLTLQLITNPIVPAPWLALTPACTSWIPFESSWINVWLVQTAARLQFGRDSDGDYGKAVDKNLLHGSIYFRSLWHSMWTLAASPVPYSVAQVQGIKKNHFQERVLQSSQRRGPRSKLSTHFQARLTSLHSGSSQGVGTCLVFRRIWYW